MEIKLNINKSIEENASQYFDNVKKLKKKLEGAKIALNMSKEKLEKLQKEDNVKQVQINKNFNIKKEWYEKFRWFYSSEGFLCIGGRDATTNEIIIKKYTEKNDIVFHTDMAGSPFFVIKVEDKKPTENTLNEVAQTTASFSKAWKLGLTTLDVFYVNPDQVTKEAVSGEFLSKGSFMIKGKTNYIKPEIKLGIGVKDNKIMCGALNAIKKHCNEYYILIPGQDKPSDIAKKLSKKFNIHSDEIIRAMPAGNSKLNKE